LRFLQPVWLITSSPRALQQQLARGKIICHSPIPQACTICWVNSRHCDAHGMPIIWSTPLVLLAGAAEVLRLLRRVIVIVSVLKCVTCMQRVTLVLLTACHMAGWLPS
jgi:hypothetical protein